MPCRNCLFNDLTLHIKDVFSTSSSFLVSLMAQWISMCTMSVESLGFKPHGRLQWSFFAEKAFLMTSCSSCYRVLPRVTARYRALPRVTARYRALRRVTACYLFFFFKLRRVTARYGALPRVTFFFFFKAGLINKTDKTSIYFPAPGLPRSSLPT